jgi:hypothetical protein
MSIRCLTLTLVASAAACGTGGSSPDPAKRLAEESVVFIQTAIPGVSWARSGGGGGSRVSQRTIQLRTVKPAPAATTAGLVGKLHERILVVLKDLGATIHGRGKTGDGENLEAFRLRFDFGGGSGTYVAWSARLEDGRFAIVVSTTAYRP